jgi:hypothetical protein
MTSLLGNATHLMGIPISGTPENGDVLQYNGTAFVPGDLEQHRKNIQLLFMQQSIYNNIAVGNAVDGFFDTFQDETGIDAGLSTIQYDSLGEYYSEIGANTWTKPAVTGSTPNVDQQGFYDPVNHNYLIHFECSDGVVHKYTIATSTWSVLSPTGGPPPARRHCGYCYDPVNHAWWMFGGYNSSDGSQRNDLWKYDIAANTWTQFTPANPPPVRDRFGGIYDPINQDFIVFGGMNVATPLNDLWKYSIPNNTWTQLSPSGGPPAARLRFLVALDSHNRCLYLFGGHDGTAYRNDLWKYDIAANTWTQISATGGPPSARANHHTCYDPWSRNIIIHGGTDGTVKSDLWKYNVASNTWTDTAASSPPVASHKHPVLDTLHMNWLLWLPFTQEMWVYQVAPKHLDLVSTAHTAGAVPSVAGASVLLKNKDATTKVYVSTTATPAWTEMTGLVKTATLAESIEHYATDKVEVNGSDQVRLRLMSDHLQNTELHGWAMNWDG